jgi:acyl-CoA thioester hydrolase
MEKDKIFEQVKQVAINDIDELEHVNNVVYLQWIMDIAQEHWKRLSTPKIRENIAWVVLRHEIDYHRSARLHDDVIIRTWVGETAGFRSVRYVEILTHDGIKIVSAKTSYCLIDPKTFRPMRITQEIRDSLMPF